MSEKSLRYNKGKQRVTKALLFAPGLKFVAAVMERGELKYPDDGRLPNWMKGGKPDAEYIDSCLEHISAFLSATCDEEEYDAEMGTHHLAHAVWNLLALLTLNRVGWLYKKTSSLFNEEGEYVG